MPARILVVDAYPREGRASLRAAGGSEGGELYRRMLEQLAPGLEIGIAHPADGERPGAETLTDWAGAVWTGSNLSVLDADDPRVSQQVELLRELALAGVPSFGSCFALQLATVAWGGRCAANPKGREFGVARAVRLSAEGRRHPLYRDKPARFDAFTSHADHVVALPAGTHCLARNDWSPVQAADLDGHEPRRPGAREGSFWAVQYHPEYDLREVASLARLRERELVDQGRFESPAALRAWVGKLEVLHADPGRDDLVSELGLDPGLLDPAERTREVRNWLAAKGLADPG